MVRKAGLIVNDGKELAVQTATSVQKKLEKSNFEVVRVSSSGGMVGFANPDQHVRPLGYTNCVPEGFDSLMEFAIVLGGDGTVLSAARQTAPAKIPILTINTGHLGFLAEAYLSNLDEAIDKIMNDPILMGIAILISVLVLYSVLKKLFKFLAILMLQFSKFVEVSFFLIINSLATFLYKSPVSKCTKPYFLANFLAKVPLPEAAVPSIAIFIIKLSFLVLNNNYLPILTNSINTYLVLIHYGKLI